MEADRAIFPKSDVAQFLVQMSRVMAGNLRKSSSRRSTGLTWPIATKLLTFLQKGETWWDKAWADGMFVGDIGYEHISGHLFH